MTIAQITDLHVTTDRDPVNRWRNAERLNHVLKAIHALKPRPVAIIASGDRTQELHRIHAPTLVIHGSADRLVGPSGGRATARAIPGASLMMIKGMGHDLPRAIWPRLIDAIAQHARRART